MAAPSLFPSEQHLGLMADLFDLSMAAGYFVHGLADRRATFELSIRKLPTGCNYLVAAGLAQAVHYLQRFSFAPEQIKFLRQQLVFSQVPAGWYEKLAGLRFEGDLWALPEGTIFFPPAPLLRVTGPLAVVQLLETYLLATLGLQTRVASRVSRLLTAAGGKSVTDFSSPHAHGPQAAMLGARAAWLGGAEATSHVEAGRRLGIPVQGAMSHAWILALGNETEGYRKFSEVFPASGTLPVETFNLAEGIRHALASGANLHAIRLEGSDLAGQSQAARGQLDAAGRKNVKIIAAGPLSEQQVAELVAVGAAIDGFKITDLAATEPLDAVYELVELETEYGMTGRARGGERRSYPYAKQVYRFSQGEGGRFEFDTIVRETELLEGDPLLVPILKGGQEVTPLPPLADSRKLCAEQRSRLNPELLGLEPANPPYRINISKHLQREAERLATAETTSQAVVSI